MKATLLFYCLRTPWRRGDHVNLSSAFDTPPRRSVPSAVGAQIPLAETSCSYGATSCRRRATPLKLRSRAGAGCIFPITTNSADSVTLQTSPALSLLELVKADDALEIFSAHTLESILGSGPGACFRAGRVPRMPVLSGSTTGRHGSLFTEVATGPVAPVFRFISTTLGSLSPWRDWTQTVF